MAGIKIYLSPSSQIANTYSVGNTNEKEQMEGLANIIKSILDNEYECECVIASKALGIGPNGRPKEAKEKGCSVYLALHSNAGGGGKASGAVAYYHPSQSQGKALAASIVRELNAICPVKSNRSGPVASGMTQYGGLGFGEIRNPANLGLIAVLAETDFHDNVRTAEWIISSKGDIARAYVKALISTFGISRKKTDQSPGAGGPEEGSKTEYYRVQVGAFSQKSGAEDMLKRLKAAGFDGYVKYE